MWEERRKLKAFRRAEKELGTVGHDYKKIYRRWRRIRLVFELAVIALVGSQLARVLERIPWHDVWERFSGFWAQLAGIAAVILCAVSLYALRKRYPRAYASLEALVAITSGWLAFSSTNPTERGLKLSAAVYLMVRSFDNWNRKPTVAEASDTQRESAHREQLAAK